MPRGQGHCPSSFRLEIIDIDDAGRQVAGLARRGLLVNIKNGQRPAVEEAGGGDARHDRQHQNRNGQEIQPAPTLEKRIRSSARKIREPQLQPNCRCCYFG